MEWKYEVLQGKFHLQQPFAVNMGIESATTGKKFICELLEKMYSLGYDFVVTSDLNRNAVLNQTDQVKSGCKKSNILVDL